MTFLSLADVENAVQIAAGVYADTDGESAAWMIRDLLKLDTLTTPEDYRYVKLEQVGSATRNGPSGDGSWDLYGDDLAQPGDGETPVFVIVEERTEEIQPETDPT